MCTNQELQDQIEALAKQNRQEHKEITATLTEWTPLIKCYQDEVTRAKAYKVVADDLKNRGSDWKFWLSVVAVMMTIVSLFFVIYEKIKFK